MKPDGTPLVFISYSWTPEYYADKVREIACRLLECHIDVKIDVWDSIPGHDLYKYMEEAVDNEEIDFVLIMCTQVYKQKANNRDSGVGAETQIIAPQVYSKHSQTKFIAVVLEKDDAGRPCKPTYMESTNHIDLSDDSVYQENFENLVRTIYRKPALVKPKLGKIPAYVKSDNIASFQSFSKYRAFEHALKNEKITMIEYFRDFKIAFIEDLKQFEIPKSEIEKSNQEEVDEFILQRIQQTAILTNLFEQLSKVFACYWGKITTEEVILFLEEFLSYSTMQCDYYRFETSKHDPRPQVFEYLLYEFLLILCTCLLDYRKFAELDFVLKRKYQASYDSKYKMAMEYITCDIKMFNHYPQSLRRIAGKQGTNPQYWYKSFMAARLTDLRIDCLVETDIIISFISYALHVIKGTDFIFWNCFITPKPPDIRLFHSMESKTRFDAAKCLFHTDNPQELSDDYDSYALRVWLGRTTEHYNSYYNFASIP